MNGRCEKLHVSESLAMKNRIRVLNSRKALSQTMMITKQ